MFLNNLDQETKEEYLNECYILFKEQGHETVEDFVEWQFPENEVNENTHAFWKRPLKNNYIMTPEREAEFREMCKKDCDRMTQENNIAWCLLSLYLDAEHDEGKREFRIVINDDKSFYIHPLSKDGKTFDGKL